MIGSSIDHLLVRDMCGYFGAEHRMADAPPTSLHPAPGMHLDYCRLPSPIGLTVVYLGYKGLTALEVQANASLVQQRFVEIREHLRRTFGAERSTPHFLSLGGIEWDFKQWGLQHKQPSSDAEWGGIRASLQMQLGAAKRLWPELRARFLRTQFRTSYRWYKGWVDVDGAEYARYNALMASLTSGAGSLTGGLTSGAGSLTGGLAGRGCGGVHLLDLSRMMNCSHRRTGADGSGVAASNGTSTYGACGRETGWTTDGLHPVGWVAREYFGLALNTMADFGEACAPVG